MNQSIKILTPDGFKPFSHIRKIKSDNNLEIKTKDFSLKCSDNHRIKGEGGWCEANSLSMGGKIETVKGLQSIISIKNLPPSFVYDPVEVEDNNSYISNGITSHNCNIPLGSSYSLIDMGVIKGFEVKKPLIEYNSVKIYEEPIKDHVYISIVDTSRGKGLDYSAISIIDVTVFPYKQVATFYDNDMSYLLFPIPVHSLSSKYNNATLVIENNDIGGHVCAELNQEYEYENLVNISKNYELGIKTTKKTKQIGCITLKELIETGQLIINDDDTLKELKTFIKIRDSYGADPSDEKNFDDLTMTLVIFAWFSTTTYFEDVKSDNIKDQMYGDKVDRMYDDLLPDLLVDNGIDSVKPKYEIVDGEVWVNDSF